MKDMVTKIFTDERGNRLRAICNTDNMCYIETGDIDDVNGYYAGYVTLDKSDLDELIVELQEIRKLMDL